MLADPIRKPPEPKAANGPQAHLGGTQSRASTALQGYADLLNGGSRTTQPAATPALSRAVAQAKLIVNGQKITSQQIDPQLRLGNQAKAKYSTWVSDKKTHRFKTWDTLKDQLQGWKSVGKDGTQTRSIEQSEKLYKKLSKEVMASHRNEPYSIDALHENAPIMSGYLDRGKTGLLGAAASMLSGMTDKSTYVGRAATDRPDIEITRIEEIRNKAFLARFEKARTELGKKNQGNPNVRHLYSGHGKPGMKFITESGHDPSYGPYDAPNMFGFGKGHGAHGRGSYFSDQVDKAISYSSKDQGTEERSFFRQEVLLGNALNYTERGRFRDRHHNEMVKSARDPANKARAEGSAGNDLAGYDSLIGQKTSQPGSSLLGTVYNRKAFDSNEYMVRNADQIYTNYRIYYKLKQAQQNA